MAFDEALAERLRAALAGTDGLSERRMFGGLAFMVDGNMACGLTAEALMVRVGPDRYEETLDEDHARPMTFTGRPMTGLVYVDPPGYATDDRLARWAGRGVAYARSLPAKRSS